MRGRTAIGAALVLLLFLAADREVSCLPVTGPPKPPARFHSYLELQEYMDELRTYYAVMARPRYDT